MRLATSVIRDQRDEREDAAPAPSACVLDLWELGVDRYETCAAALARLIFAQPERVGTFGDPAVVEECFRAALKEELGGARGSDAGFWFSAIAQFQQLTGRTGAAEAAYRDALRYLKTTRGPDGRETRALLEEMERFLRGLGREKEAISVAHELRVASLLARRDGESLLSLRQSAFGAFSAGCFAEAEAIYRHLLARNFEPAGTHCHLARVLLALGRDADAASEVESATEGLPVDEAYIAPRVHFLRALLATLAGEDAGTPVRVLRETLLHNPGARNAWLIAPVLERVRPRLTPESYKFFTRLAKVMSGGLNE